MCSTTIEMKFKIATTVTKKYNIRKVEDERPNTNRKPIRRNYDNKICFERFVLSTLRSKF